jgi:hypothetical protein
MTALSEFLLARIAEDEEAARHSLDGDIEYLPSVTTKRGDVIYLGVTHPTRVLAECEAKRKIVALHESWLTLVQTPAKLERDDDGNLDNYVFRMSQEIAWLTTREYVTRFGTDPPTAPMLAALAAVYADHPDYDEEWRP